MFHEQMKVKVQMKDENDKVLHEHTVDGELAEELFKEFLKEEYSDYDNT